MTLPKGWNSKSTYQAFKREEKQESTKEGDISKRKKRALIVSISNYNKLEALPFCQNDGKEMYFLLKSCGYEMFNDNRLIGGEVRYDDLRQGLIDLLTDDKNIHPQDTLLFYFSGHGLPDGYDGTYLATSDIDPNRPFDKGISFDDITRWMNISKSKRIISILDCCCSGSIGLTKGDEETTASLVRASMEKKTKMLKEGEGKCILAASTGTQEAYGSKKQDHSIFTYHLLEGLRGASGESVDKDGNVTPESLSNYVYDKVTEQTSIKQKPVTKVDTSGRIILVRYPNLGKGDISNLITQGFIFMQMKNYLNAIECFNKVLASQPQNHFIWYIQAESYFNLNQFDKSIKCYEKTLEIDPNNEDAKNKIKLATQKLEDAKNKIKWYKQAESYFNLNQFDKSIKCYEKTLEIDPNNEDAKKKRDIALEKHKELKFSLIIKEIKSKYEANEFSKVIDFYNAALEIDPETKNIVPYLYKGLSFGKLERNEEAISSFDKVLEIEPDNIQALNGKARAFYSLENFENAVEFYDKVLRINPNNEDAKNKIKLATQKLESVPYNSRFSTHEKIQNVDVLHNLYALPKLSEMHWENLLNAIERKSCIPFIGDSALEFFNQADDESFLTSKELAKNWAQKYEYPFEGVYELPKVAQYLAIREGLEMYPKQLVSSTLRQLKLPNFSLDKYKESPHAILAQLDLPIYITTNYDLLLEEALKSQGKEPVSEICRWNDALIEATKEGIIPYVFQKESKSKYVPTPDKPLVFHLFGSIEYPESMVLTERDYSDFITYTNREEVLPTILRIALVKSSLLFIGYRSDNLDFRAIFQGVLSFMSAIPRYTSSIAVLQVPSSENDNIKHNKKLEYFTKYIANMFKILVYWEYSGQFIQELQIKWKEFKNNS